MPTIDGPAAARTMRAFGSNRAGYCLLTVWLAYKAHGAYSAITYPTAYSAWQATRRRHSDRTPPAGVPVWFGKRPDSAAGDVVISLGGGRVIATDYPTWGRIGECTIDQRQAQINRPYLGWSEDFLGNTIAHSGAEQEDDMPTPEEYARAVWAHKLNKQSAGSRLQQQAGNSAKAVWEYPMEPYSEGTEYAAPAESTGRRLRRSADRAGRTVVLGRRADAQIAGLTAALKVLSEAQGGDSAELLNAITHAVDKAVADQALTFPAESEVDEE